ncbi:unnamed protein product [Diatraea saccharalis]|uniref:Serpin domain-containing protein n=1 Tax=Diatraea saccharalis TaxID=40085 RepID=A0A9N9RBM5_9NEOP|nr:unnamed protein product [Diatraea saccharalis]
MLKKIVSALFVLTFQSVITNGQQPVSRLSFFDIDILRYCAEERRGNVMVSPASVKATLAMLLEGCQGATEVEIRSALRLAPSKEEYREQLNLYLEGLKTNTSGVILQNANSVFVSDNLKMRKEYEAMLKSIYQAEVFKMNFTDIDGSVDIINRWVSTKTKGLIPAIVDPVNVNPSSDMVLANAMYFKGSWQRSFDPKETTGACFYDQGTCKKVQMMSTRAQLKYAYIDELRAHAVDLPYEGSRYSMILLVPVDRDGCAPLIRDLPYKNLNQIVSHLEPYDVQLSLPKFSIDYSEDMVGPLKSMRVTTLFSSSSNLSGIFENDSPYINSMYHKVHMTVDEQGTIAAAATAAMVVPLIEDGVQLQVDRPFVFFIRDNALGLVLFEGRIEDPTPFVESAPAKAPVSPSSPAQLIPAGPPTAAVSKAPQPPAAPQQPIPITAPVLENVPMVARRWAHRN